LAAVSGTVTLAGQPVGNAELQFTPIDVELVDGTYGGSSGFAETDAEGRYTAHTGREPGLQPGTYRVQISKTDFDDTGAEKNTIPAEYNTRSKLEIEVVANEATTHDFALQSK